MTFTDCTERYITTSAARKGRALLTIHTEMAGSAGCSIETPTIYRYITTYKLVTPYSRELRDFNEPKGLRNYADGPWVH